MRVDSEFQTGALTPQSARHLSRPIAAHTDTLLLQQSQGSFTYILGGEAVFTHHDVARSRGAEPVYAQHVSAIADVAMPALRCTRLNGKPRRRFTLTTNYRNPAEIAEVAARVLAQAAPGTESPKAVRATGVEPRFVAVATEDAMGAAARAPRSSRG